MYANRATIKSEQGFWGFLDNRPSNMSTHEEIMAVYEADIYQKTMLVESKFGKSPFYDNFNGFGFCTLFDHAGIDRIQCSEFTPKRTKWSKKYGKSLGEKA